MLKITIIPVAYIQNVKYMERSYTYVYIFELNKETEIREYIGNIGNADVLNVGVAVRAICQRNNQFITIRQIACT